MKRILLNILTITTISLGAIAQDSTGMQVDQEIPMAFAASFASISTTSGSNLHMNGGDWTLETWVEIPSSVNFNHEIHLIETYSSIASWGGYVLRLTGGRINTFVFNQISAWNLTGNTQVNTGWNHVAATYSESAGELKVYLNGVLDGTAAYFITPFNSNPGLYIGARGDDQGVNQPVVIDEVRIWNVARSESELDGAKDNCLVGDEAGLLAYYDFENISGGIVSDVTNNSNTASLTTAFLNDGVFQCSTLSLNENDGLSSEVEIYPNPTHSILNIEGSFTIEKADVIALDGSVVMSTNEHSFTVENLAPGIYMLFVYTDNGLFKERFVKQ